MSRKEHEQRYLLLSMGEEIEKILPMCQKEMPSFPKNMNISIEGPNIVFKYNIVQLKLSAMVFKENTDKTLFSNFLGEWCIILNFSKEKFVFRESDKKFFEYIRDEIKSGWKRLKRNLKDEEKKIKEGQQRSLPCKLCGGMVLIEDIK